MKYLVKSMIWKFNKQHFQNSGSRNNNFFFEKFREYIIKTMEVILGKSEIEHAELVEWKSYLNDSLFTLLK